MNQKNIYEKYEKNLILFALVVFIILGVLFLVFIMPRFHKAYNASDFQKMDGSGVADYADKNKNVPEDNYKTGRDFFNRHNYSAALDYFEAAAKDEPDNIGYLTELAVTHYQLKNYREAIKIYEKIISLDEDNAFAYNSAGNIYWIIKETEKAEYYFRKAIELNLNLIAAYNNLALMLNENGNKAEAIEVLNQGIAANPDSVELKERINQLLINELTN